MRSPRASAPPSTTSAPSCERPPVPGSWPCTRATSRAGARLSGWSPPWSAASMSSDAAALRTERAGVGGRATRAPSLTGRASLNALQSLLDYGAKLGVGLVVTPIVVAGLGGSLFGVWEMLNRLVTYMSAADGRPTEALRLIVSSRQAVEDDALQRRAVGAALLIWVLFLPLIAAVGAILIWIAPTITHVAPALRGAVRAVTALLLLSFFLTLVAGVPESVLRGMHLGSRRMRSAAMPGLGGLIGRGEQDRARAVRHELLTLTWLFATTVGVTVLCWNRSFLGLWVGQQHYGGPWLDLLIVLAAVQTVFIRTDAYVIDAALRPRPRVLAGAGAALVTIVVAVPLTRLFGAVGLCVGLLAGRAVQSAAYPLLVRDSLGSRGGPHWSEATRLAVVTALLFAAALFLGQRVRTSHWVVWGAGVALAAALAFVTALFAGPAGEGRRLGLPRLRALRPALGW